MTLRERAVRLIWNLLLGLLLVILNLYLGCPNWLSFINLRRRLTVLLDEHGRVNLIDHVVASRHVHRLLSFLDSLGRLLSTVLRKRHSHSSLSLVCLPYYCLASIRSLRLWYLLIIARAYTLRTSDMLRMHQVSESLALIIFYLQIMWFVANKRQIMMIIVRILNTKLTISVHAPVNHLRIIIISLRLNLVPYILLENVIWLVRYLLWVLDGCHHVRPRSEVWIVATFKWLELVLTRRHDSLVWIRGAYVIVLEPLSTGNSIGSISRHLFSIVHNSRSYLLMVAACGATNKLRVLLSMHLLVVCILILLLLSSIKRNLNSPIGVPYFYKNKISQKWLYNIDEWIKLLKVKGILTVGFLDAIVDIFEPWTSLIHLLLLLHHILRGCCHGFSASLTV